MHTCKHAHICIVAISSICSIPKSKCLPIFLEAMSSSSSDDKASKGSKKAKIPGMYMRELPMNSQPAGPPQQQQQQQEEEASAVEASEVEASEDEGEDLQIQAVDHHKYMDRALANVRDGIVKKQRDQAIQQARHWQATAQKQRAKICKLEAENKNLVEMHDAMGHWMMQDPVMFRQWEQKKKSAPVPVPKPVPVPPVGPPPSYLIRRFQSQNVLGLTKANAIGKGKGKVKVKLGKGTSAKSKAKGKVKKHAKSNLQARSSKTLGWAKAPVPKD